MKHAFPDDAMLRKRRHRSYNEKAEQRHRFSSLLSSVEDRINGNHDLRMLPIAITIWLTELLLPLILNYDVTERDSSRTFGIAQAHGLGSMPLMLCISSLIIVLIVLQARKHWRCTHLVRLIPSFLTLMAAEMMAVTSCLLLTIMTQASNPLNYEATATQSIGAETALAQSDNLTIMAVMKLEEPWQRSVRLEYDVMAHGRLIAIAYNHVGTQGSATVNLFIKGEAVRLERGGTYKVFGTLKQSSWGSEELWFTAETRPAEINKPPPHWRIINAMHRSFAKVVTGLSDQGRLLVTGLTLGTLTEMKLSDETSAGSTELDERFVQRSKHQFRSAGIIHLMAVSGGHFALIATLCRWIRALSRLPRLPIAIMHSIFSVILGWLVFPSDSVLRAAATTASLASLAMIVGRKGQSVQQLNIIVSFVLIVRPTLAASYGFALSCAAVLGIGLWANGLTASLRRIMPISMAQMVSIALSAQALTLPIQILLQPEITVLSIPANLVVAPFAGFATVCGLLAVLVSWCAPQLGWLLVWSASCATSIIDRWAAMCSEPHWATLPWAQGIPGAVMAAGCEIGIVASCYGIARLRGRIHEAKVKVEAEFSSYRGTRFEKSKLDPIRLWWAPTIAMLDFKDSPEYRISRLRHRTSRYPRKFFRAKHHVQR